MFTIFLGFIFPFSFLIITLPFLHTLATPLLFVLFLMSTRILTCFSIHREELKKVEAAKRR